MMEAVEKVGDGVTAYSVSVDPVGDNRRARGRLARACGAGRAARCTT